MRRIQALLSATLLAAAAAACADAPTAAVPGDVQRPPSAPLATMNPSTSRVVGYFPTWSGSPDSLQYSKLTHINYAFVLPTSSGGLTGVAMSGNARLTSLVQKAHAAGVKVLISIGGWNNGDDSAFRTMAASSTARSTFVNNVITFVTNYGLDGVDIDWEYPDSGTEPANYTTLMSQLSSAMHTRGKLLTAAVAADQPSGGDGIQSAVFGYVDYLMLMAYDGGTPHSPYSYAVASLDYWSGRGLPQSKTVLGVPFYGSNAAGSQKSYRDIVALDPSAPWTDYSGGYYYNGVSTMKQKTTLALQRASGVGIWELTQDTQGSTSLLNAIIDVMNAPTLPPPPATVYGDALSTGWEDWSWDATTNFAVTSPVEAGTYSIGATFSAPWAALYLHNDAFNPAGFTRLEFWIHGGSSGGQNLVVYVEDAGGASLPHASVNAYVAGGSVVAGAWRKVSIPLSALGVSSYAIEQVAIHDETGGVAPTFYVDDIQFVP